jgi:transcriptional regulator GlxA family with amidase domain
VRIDILVYDGADELDFVGPLEVFRAAAQNGADVQARLVTLNGRRAVRAAHGLAIEADAAYEPGADTLLVPGGGWLARSDPGAWGEFQRGELLAVIRDAHETASTLAGVCTGSMLLAHAGVIGSRPATTHHGAWDELVATGATLVRDRVADDGDLVTCGGVTSGLDLALWLVERHATTELADAIATNLEYARFRPPMG